MISWQKRIDFMSGSETWDGRLYGTDQLCCKPRRSFPASEFNGDNVNEHSNAQTEGSVGT